MDVILSNDTDTLIACFLASKIRRKKLVFDAHELFPEVPELHGRPFIKNFWAGIENNIFPHLKQCYTVSASIAKYYNDKYGIEMKVVRNIPTFNNNILSEEKPLNFEGKKIILYQGALNTGRGIEWIIKAMPSVENAVFVIIGDGDIQEELLKLTADLKITDKVKFLGKIGAHELHNYTLAADVGVCLLENKGLSYYYSLPNRIFAFLHAGVPVLATDFPEIRNFVEKYQTGVLISETEPEEIAKAINEILSKPFPVSHFKALAQQFCWENEEKIIIDVFNSAITNEI